MIFTDIIHNLVKLICYPMYPCISLFPSCRVRHMVTCPKPNLMSVSMQRSVVSFIGDYLILLHILSSSNPVSLFIFDCVTSVITIWCLFLQCLSDNSGLLVKFWVPCWWYILHLYHTFYLFSQVISSSLLAVATVVDILLGVKLESHDDENVNLEQKLVSKARRATISSAENMFSVHKYFLEFLKSKNSAIRSSSYSVLTSFIKHIPHAFNEGNMKMLSPVILGAFQEKDVSCHSSMWDMILLFSRKFPGSWSHCNVQKVVLNRVWLFLRNGCYGSQTISYPAMILFLESIPPEAVVWEQFIFDFFHNLWAGRNQLHSSAPDTLALFNAVKECFLWELYNAPRCNSIWILWVGYAISSTHCLGDPLDRSNFLTHCLQTVFMQIFCSRRPIESSASQTCKWDSCRTTMAWLSFVDQLKNSEMKNLRNVMA